jgi:hypothetical protein
LTLTLRQGLMCPRMRTVSEVSEHIEMLIADERYASTYERQAEGLAAYVREAIVANADVVGVG